MTDQALIGPWLFPIPQSWGPVPGTVGALCIMMLLTFQKITFNEAHDRASQPLKTFMPKQTRDNDIVLFSELGKRAPDSDAKKLSLPIIVPAFFTSELKTALQIGFMILIAFLIINPTVYSALVLMDIMMVSPALIVLLFKPLLCAGRRLKPATWILCGQL